MILKRYTKRILRAENNPNLESLYCFAELEDDIEEVFPYLKKVFGEATYSEEIPFLALKLHGKNIKLYPRRIGINAIKNAEEADVLLGWLQKVINEVWEKRTEIRRQRPVLSIADPITIFDMLPQSHCQECGQESCMSFSILVADGIKGPDDCPRISHETKLKLKAYLALFHSSGFESSFFDTHEEIMP